MSIDFGTMWAGFIMGVGVTWVCCIVTVIIPDSKSLDIANKRYCHAEMKNMSTADSLVLLDHDAVCRAVYFGRKDQ